ncbi:hypothetical protein [Sedimenticola hydrogenitrophicus]|uniref:hypothetical protein n=1 Tax=Sedimenticola hydrogenitrophicus TaxID=2967975 RepID=UPI0023B15E42|nr:hypothetical protein [Sedimenticola hydrogenitrophicus]
MTSEQLRKRMNLQCDWIDDHLKALDAAAIGIGQSGPEIQREAASRLLRIVIDSTQGLVNEMRDTVEQL